MSRVSASSWLQYNMDRSVMGDDITFCPWVDIICFLSGDVNSCTVAARNLNRASLFASTRRKFFQLAGMDVLLATRIQRQVPWFCRVYAFKLSSR